MLNSTNLKLKKIKLEKLGALAFFALFTIVSFLTGSSISNAATSGAALPISFGGTGAKTQSAALTNLGINSTIDENSNNNTFPSAKTVYEFMNKAMTSCDNIISKNGNVSNDNTNFYNTICSWTGGDLIYKSFNLSSTASNNKIKVGDKACTTSGKGYVAPSTSAYPRLIGCVLPNLQAGTYAVTISTDGGTNYTINAGNVVYAKNAKLSNCDTTSMQTFGANATNCRAAMQQGQVIVLNDTRDNQKYRVKKMPDGYVWMIDNLKYANDDYRDPSSIEYCSPSGNVRNHNPGSLTNCGYLYNWNTAMTVSPSGWGLHPYNGSKSAENLEISMDDYSKNNPVYGYGIYNDNWNFSNIDGDDNTKTKGVSPWGAVYSGGYYYDKFDRQVNASYYWSSATPDFTVNDALYIHLAGTMGGSVSIHDSNNIGDFLAVRAVL
jgi:uncharacterized protein (TIGR02145 family)